MKDFNAQLGGIAHTLRDRSLVVPAFQRDYSWGKEQVEDYWFDLKASLASGRSYFIGTIVLSAESRDSWNLIDGQQRLATTSLLIAAISHEWSARGDQASGDAIQHDYLRRWSIGMKSMSPRLMMNLKDRDAFSAVLERGAPDGEGASKLMEAYRVLRDNVRAEAEASGPHWSERLARWVAFLEHDVQAIVMETRDDADAFMVFETLNDRGLALTVADLIKNNLLSYARDSLDAAVELWNEATQTVESSVGVFDFTTFMRTWWSSKHGATRERALYPSVAAQVSNELDALSVLNDLVAAAPYYSALFDDSHSLWDQLGDRARASARILLELGAEQARPLALAIVRSKSDDAPAMLELLVKAVLRSLVLGRAGGGTAERVYAEAAVRVSNERVSTAGKLRIELDPLIGGSVEFGEAVVSRRIFRIAVQKYMALAIASNDPVSLRSNSVAVQIVHPVTIRPLRMRSVKKAGGCAGARRTGSC